MSQILKLQSFLLRSSSRSSGGTGPGLRVDTMVSHKESKESLAEAKEAGHGENMFTMHQHTYYNSSMKTSLKLGRNNLF